VSGNRTADEREPGGSHALLSIRHQAPISLEALRFEFAQVFAGLAILFLTGLTSVFVGHLIVRYEALHSRWSHDQPMQAHRNFIRRPPANRRLGSDGGSFRHGGSLARVRAERIERTIGYLLIASLPAFLGGITEDVTKNVGVLTRLLLTMLAAAFGVWLLGAVIPRLDIPASIPCSSGRRLR